MNAPLRQVAYTNFKNRLFDRTLTPGKFVTQRELCELLESPMGAVREALKRLEAEGLIDLLPQRGVQIANIDVNFINEAFQFRLLIEKEAVRRAARAPDIARLEEVKRRTETIHRLASVDKAEDAELMAEGLRVDLEMHICFVGGFENTLIQDTYESIEDRVRLIRLNGNYDNKRLVRAMTEHLGIISAVLEGDEDASVRALTDHLATSWRRALGNKEFEL